MIDFKRRNMKFHVSAVKGEKYEQKETKFST